LRNAIDPFALAEEFIADALLSYLLRHIPRPGDADFSRGRFPQGYESDLACAPRIRKTFSFTFAG
jgi:methionyl-tRNA synthetase